MSIKWNEITWYSRILWMLVFVVAVPIIAFQIGIAYEDTQYSLDATQAYALQPLPPLPPAKVPIQSTTTPSGNASSTESAAGTLKVTLTDLNKVVSLKVGQRFVLSLGDYDWTLSFSKDGIVSRVKNIMVLKGSQGVYTADAPGTTVLTAEGRPYCAAGEMCAQFILGFKTTIAVSK
jgi:hypothetical protein